MEQLFLQAIREGLQRESRERTHFYFTDIGRMVEGCARSLWLEFQDTEKQEIGIGKLLMFEHGNKIHETIGNLLVDSTCFDVIDLEQRCELNYKGEKFSGRYDCKANVNGEEVIIDFKTVRGKAFQYLNEPKESAVAQVQAYLMATELRTGYLVYIDREGQNGFRIFEIGRDDDSVRNLMSACIYSKHYEPMILEPKFSKKELKTKTNYYVHQPWQCQYCNFYGTSCVGALPKELDVGKSSVASFIPKIDKDKLIIREGFEKFFENMEVFDEEV